MDKGIMIIYSYNLYLSHTLSIIAISGKRSVFGRDFEH
jgi:hypothetical protein